MGRANTCEYEKMHYSGQSRDVEVKGKKIKKKIILGSSVRRDKSKKKIFFLYIYTQKVLHIHFPKRTSCEEGKMT